MVGGYIRVNDRQMPDAGVTEADSQRMVTVTYVDRTGNEIESVEVQVGTTLRDALAKIGVVLGLCGGYGVCGGCAVEITDGRLVQGCFYRANQDITVRRRR